MNAAQKCNIWKASLRLRSHVAGAPDILPTFTHQHRMLFFGNPTFTMAIIHDFIQAPALAHSDLPKNKPPLPLLLFSFLRFWPQLANHSSAYTSKRTDVKSKLLNAVKALTIFMLQAAASAPISPFDFEASVSDTAAAGIWYFEGIEAAIAECDQDCDRATTEGDYDEAGRIFAIQENLRKVAALNPQPNAKATLESFVHNFEAMKVLSYLKENKLKEQEKAYAACKQFALAKESRGAADAAHADGELYVKEFQVRLICDQACGLHLLQKYHPAQSGEKLHCIALQKNRHLHRHTVGFNLL